MTITTSLGELLPHVGLRAPAGLAERPVKAVSFSRDALGPEVIGVGVRDWHGDYHESVLGGDALVTLVDRGPTSTRPDVLRVPNANVAFSTLAAELEGRPADRFPIIGVTGTDGKTTITALVYGALSRLGWRAARTGTLGAELAGEPYPLSRTTPHAPELHALFSAMLERGCQAAVMEIGSFALKAHRVDAVGFHLGVFTNLTRDHLDVHGSMEVYGAAKARLFGELLRPDGRWPRALLCADSPRWTEMRAPPSRWTYGFHADADLQLRDLQLSPEGCAATLRTPVGEGALRCRLPGRYNAQNAAAAIGALLTLDVPLAEACEAVGRVPGPPGRMERIPNALGLSLIVDYAHTPNGLRSALTALRPLTRGKLWVMFGCGGERDRGKRALMGAASELADEVVLTSDNSRSEPTASIVGDIRSGMSRAPTHVELVRSRAVRWLVCNASPGDSVLFAGAGHELTQELDGVRHPYTEQGAVRAALLEMS